MHLKTRGMVSMLLQLLLLLLVKQLLLMVQHQTKGLQMLPVLPRTLVLLVVRQLRQRLQLMKRLRQMHLPQTQQRMHSREHRLRTCTSW